MMRRFLSLVCFVAVSLVTVAILTWARANAACDGKGASESTGACYSPTGLQRLCSSATEQRACGVVWLIWIHVEEGFPKECVTLANNNCNEKNAKCHVVVDCQWKDGQCQEVPDSYTDYWHLVPKKQTDPCPPEG